jgi:putative ABC transport system permease protein
MLFRLAWKSLKNRRLTTTLTVLSIALSVGLLVAVAQVRTGARQSFENTISGTDLIVGARSGAVNLLLYTVFRIGNATNNISWEAYSEYSEHPAVEWTIPYSLGDSHRGFRVVATDSNFYERYRFFGDRSIEFSSGEEASDVFEVVLGADVARELEYELGQEITLSHGMTESFGSSHDDKPFTVSGTLRKTGTPIDRSLYITLEGMEALHIDWQDGAPPMMGEEIPASEIRTEDLQPAQITAFLLRTKTRIDSIRLQRDVE